MAQLLSTLKLFLRVHSFLFLLLCYLLFILLGAVVFSAVEKPVEEELKAEVEEVWSSFLKENPCVEEEKLREVLRRSLSAHHRNVPVLKEEEDEEEGNSGFSSSLYFVIVTLTTMGKMITGSLNWGGEYAAKYLRLITHNHITERDLEITLKEYRPAFDLKCFK